MKRQLALTTVAASLLLVGCANDANGGPRASTDSTEESPSDETEDSNTPSDTSGSSDDDDDVNQGEVVNNGSDQPADDDASPLSNFASCDDLLSYIKNEALSQVGPYGLEQGGYGPEIFVDEAATDATMADSGEAGDGSTDAADSSASGSPTGRVEAAAPSETGTNVQEAGVDEPDIIKTDGERIVTLNDGVLTVSDITERAPVETGRLKLDNYPHTMMLAGDRLFLFSDGGGYGGPIAPLDGDTTVDAGAPDATTSPEDLDGNDTFDEWVAVTTITEVSLDGSPSVSGTKAVEGYFQAARLVGNKLRVSLSSPAQSLPWVYPQNPAGEDAAAEANRKVIEDSTIDDWMPQQSTDGGDISPLLECESVHRPSTFTGFELVSLLEVDVETGLGGADDASEGVGLFAMGGTVYSSQDRFYVAATNWNTTMAVPESGDAEEDFVESEPPRVTTDIHAFAISDEAPPTYVASGRVDGTLLNQFSLDEYDGHLRVITTQNEWEVNADGESTSESFLRVLAEDGQELTQVGVVGGLGKGEQLYSARLFDEVGFAVTFRQVDPFYVLDLSNPTDPKITGELKIPGFSTYLHPVGDGRILGVGAAATDEGQRTGLKVSLFDVNDPSNPTEVSTWVTPDAYSLAENEYHAFHFSDGVAVIPVESWGGASGTNNGGSIVLSVEDKLVQRGRIDIVETDAQPTSDCRPLEFDAEDPNFLFSWVSQEGGRLQVCGSDSTGGWGDQSCWQIRSADELSANLGSDVAETIDVARGEYLEVCEPIYGDNQVRRVISVNDTFYSMSNRSLQANDRTSLEPLGVLPLAGGGGDIIID